MFVFLQAYLSLFTMRKNTLILLIISLLLSYCSNSSNDIPLRVMSFNIRYDNPRDGLNTWNNRKEIAVETIISNKTDIVGMQEVLLSQQKYLEDKLTAYSHYAVGRDDGKTRGEMGSIFYLKDRFEALEKNTFWLSETPDSIGSKGWNAVLPRIVSWIKFRDKENNQEFYFFNTHFSHVGEEARTNSAKILVKKAAEISGGMPIIISGDFNCTEETEAYKIITKEAGELTLYNTHYLSDEEHYGGLNTINGFGRSKREAIIDYLFCNSGFKVNRHGVLPIIKDSIYISDHYPVVAEMEFLKK